MLDHDTGRMDWDAAHSQHTMFPSTSYAVNPENIFDVSTPRGRELMDEVYPSSRRSILDEGTHSPLLFIIIIIAMLIGFFIIPGGS